MTTSIPSLSPPTCVPQPTSSIAGTSTGVSNRRPYISTPVSTPSSSSEFTSSSLLLSSPVSIASVSTYQRGTTSAPSTVTTTSYPQPKSNPTSSQCTSVSKFIFTESTHESTESQIVSTSYSTSISGPSSSSEFTSSHISVSLPTYSASLSPKVSNQAQKEEKFICLNKVVVCLFVYFDYTG